MAFYYIDLDSEYYVRVEPDDDPGDLTYSIVELTDELYARWVAARQAIKNIEAEIIKIEKEHNRLYLEKRLSMSEGA